MAVTDSNTFPDWFHIDEVISPERRKVIEEQVRAVAETIISVRDVFEVARAQLSITDRSLGDLPTELYDAVSEYTSVDQLHMLLYAFSEVVSPDSSLDGLHTRVERLDAELAKVPGLS